MPWRHCSSCKQEIDYGATYYVCSVSTCQRARTGLAFCSVDCWDAHLPGARHREAWAEDRVAPASAEAAAAPKPRTRKPKRTVMPARKRDPGLPREILVVASRLKAYVKASGDMNTSDAVLEVLSEKLRDLCDGAIERAKEDGRKTILDRDFGPRR